MQPLGALWPLIRTVAFHVTPALSNVTRRLQSRKKGALRASGQEMASRIQTGV